MPLRIGGAVVPGILVRLVASGVAETQSELVAVTGMARSSCAAAIGTLVDGGVLRYSGIKYGHGRGRPAERLRLATTLGRVLAVDMRPDSARLAVHDLGQRRLAAHTVSLDVSTGPARTLEVLVRAARELAAGRPADDEQTGDGDPVGPLLAAAVAVPAPVDPARGVFVRPPIMPGWDGYPVAAELRAALGCPVVVENDSTVRALGEARYLPPDQSPLVFVDIHTGIGSGLVTAAGEQYLGAQGGAGDIGHIRVPGAGEAPCSCGKTGCVEAVASAPAVLRRLRELRPDGSPADLDGLYAAIRAGEPDAVRVVRDAAAALGEAIATVVHILNPARVALGGAMTEASDDVLAVVRSVVYQQALPLATRNLVLNQSVLGAEAGVLGGVVLAVEHALADPALLTAGP
jgi:predicted NBD/HSP70 family sugar kinase